MKLSVERLLTLNGSSLVNSRARIKLEDYDPSIAATYVAASQNIGSETDEIGCEIIKGSKLDPIATLFNQVQQSIGRITINNPDTLFYQSSTKMLRTNPNRASITVTGDASDPKKIEASIQKGVDAANKIFAILEGYPGANCSETPADPLQSEVIFEG